MSRFKYLIFSLLLLPAITLAAPTTNYFLNIAPTITDTYNNGTASLEWLNQYAKFSSTTQLTVSGQLNGCAQFDGTGFLKTTGTNCATASTFGTTSINATAPLNWNTTTATMSITQSGIGSNGYLSSTDFNTFNNKVSSTSLSVTTTGTSGAATYNPTTGVFNIPIYANTTYSAGTGLTLTGTTFSVNTTQNITTLSNLSTAGTLNNTASGVLYSTGTSTPTVTAPITYSGTLGQFIGGVSGTFACTTASAGVTGCLSGTDYNTFNGKQNAIALGAGTVNSSASNVLYATATTSVSSGTGISFTGTPGALIGGTSLTITNSGVTSNVAGTGISVSGATGAVTITNTGVTSLAVTSPITTSGSTGSITVGCASCLIANQTVTLSGVVTGSGTTAITTAFGTVAANTVLANGTGATAVPTFVATSSLFTGTTGQVDYFASSGGLTGTSSLFISTAGFVGVGSTSPSAPFTVSKAINAVSLDLNNHVMVIQNTGSGNLPFVIDNSGGGNPNFAFSTDGNIKATVGFLRSTNRVFMTNIAFSGNGQSFLIDSSGNIMFQNGDTNVELARLSIGGNFGIGTSSPVAKLDVYSSVSSTTPLLLEAVSGGGCIIIKDVAGTGYTQLYTQAGVLTAKVHTGVLSACN